MGTTGTIGETAQQMAQVTGHVVAGGITVATLMEWLPAIAAGLSIVWLLIQIGSWLYKVIKNRKNK